MSVYGESERGNERQKECDRPSTHWSTSSINSQPGLGLAKVRPETSCYVSHVGRRSTTS